MKVKVCGMTSIDQLHQLGEMNVDYAGLIFYPKSPRYVLNHLKGEEVKNELFLVEKIGVFVNAPVEEVLKQVHDFGLDMVQLHGDETTWECQQISEHVKVIKAFRLQEEDSLEWVTRDYIKTDMFLFDSPGKAYGGTGKKFNWDHLLGKKIGKPFFLSGGIAPGDVPILKSFLEDKVAEDLYAIDINSRFETAPGVKDLKAIETFMHELKEAGLLLTETR